jgi:hypothetical protein
MCVCMCMCVCMFGHNSGTPGAISTELGTHMVVCMCKNLMYILCIYIFYLLSIIFSREDGVGDLHVIHPPGVISRCRCNVYANRYRSNSQIVCVVLEHTYKRASICIYLILTQPEIGRRLNRMCLEDLIR